MPTTPCHDSVTASPAAPKDQSPLTAAPRQPILLVGDDLAWLSGRLQVAGREIVVSASDSDALALLAQTPFDALVASCPDASRSVALLREATAAHPSLVALLRADTKELTAISNSFPVIPRVAAVEVLDDQLRTKLAETTWKANPAFASLTAQITKLPTLPSIYTQITTALQSPDVCIEDIAELVSREPAVSAKLLQMVNSPLLGLRGRVTSVRDATSLLGMSRLRSLVLATSLFRQFDASRCPSFSMKRFEANSLQVASWAATIVKDQRCDKRVADMAFTASLLHNFGVLLLAANLPERYDQVLKSAQERRVSIAWAELETFGATHAEIAGTILATWGLPFPIVNAVGWYPVPSSSDDSEFTPLTAVHAATAVDTYARTGMLAYDRTYIDRLSLTAKLENWCASLPGENLAA